METIIAFIIVLGILIFVHELGHFIFAKLLGVGVLKFSLGFGPKILGKKIGETDYMISAFPLGGYVKMVGESPGEEVPEDLEKISFTNKSYLNKMSIVAAGPVFNIFFAVLLLSSLWIYGVPALTTKVGEVKQGLPAYEAGIKEGDRVLSVMDKPVKTWEEMAALIHKSSGPVALKLKRDGEVYEVTVSPQLSKVKNVFGEMEDARIIGVASSGETVIIRHNPITALYMGTSQTARLVELTFIGLGKLIKGKVPLKDSLGGPILIAQLTGEQVKQGMRSLIFFVALLSVNLGIINLFPIPILDGGHLLFFTIERIIRRPLSEKGMEMAQRVGMAILALLMVLVVYNDILRLIHKH